MVQEVRLPVAFAPMTVQMLAVVGMITVGRLDVIIPTVDG
jgi:hypothetical protein